MLDAVDVVLEASRDGEDEGDTDDADRPGEGDEDGAGFFGEEVVKRKAEGSPERHVGLFGLFLDVFA